jgi:hypothetical protein
MLTPLLLSLLAYSPASAPSPDEPTQAFTDWAAAQNVPVEQPACGPYQYSDGTDRGDVICYGLTGDDGAGGYGDVVVALGVLDGTGYGFVPLLGALAAPTGTAPTGPTTTGGAASATSFGPGIQLVGTDIQPGTYRAVVPEGEFITLCTWQRLSGLSGEIADIIAIDNVLDVGSQVVVEIQPSDVAFDSSGCGTWTRVEGQ